MRRLSVTRHKSFVGCAGTFKVYIEDAENGETTINGVKYRKLFSLKNGESSTAEITNEAVKVCVIADMASRNYCNDIYCLDEGEYDVELSGKCKFGLGRGNGFVFDGNNSPEAVAARRNGSNKGTIIFIISVIAGAVIGYLIARFIIF